MRKNISLFILMVFLMGAVSGCTAAKESKSSSTANEDASLSIVTTIFPEYDWVREIIGDANADAELTLLAGSGVDLHSFQPKVDDILTISTCDLFIYVGGESDEWVEDALAEAENEDMVVISLLDVLGDFVKEEESVEGMEEEEDEGEAEEDEDEIEYDEHVWLSLNNAQVICDAITEALKTLDEANAKDYSANNEAYCEKLSELDAQYRSVCENADTSTLLFGDRFPFRYLTDDYNLTYYAAFNGCSAETEASFETIVFLAQKADELGLEYILTIETSDQKIAETIIRNTQENDQQILVMNSMQAVTKEDIDAGISYLGIAEENLDVLEKALM